MVGIDGSCPAAPGAGIEQQRQPRIQRGASDEGIVRTSSRAATAILKIDGTTRGKTHQGVLLLTTEGGRSKIG